MKFFSKRLAVLLLSIICVISLAGVLAGCKGCGKSNQPVEIDDSVTTRKPVPTDGSTPKDHSAEENVAYLAYVLENQPFYHAYAYNSTKAIAGYEQVTKTWKDYKSAEASGEEADVMVASDLSYSTFIKSSSQSCFIDDGAALRRSGSKPGKNTTATEVEWSKDSAPSYYEKKDYLGTYGLFSTELSVYVINSSTIEGADAVTDNGDGTYSQKFYLKKEAGIWYQYVMKTNGGLKTYPEFKRIELTFTFDSKWQVLSSYCEEKIVISPTVLGGNPVNSTSKTTTEYDYTEEGFDNVHFGYYNDFFKKYEHEKPGNNGGNDNPVQAPTVLDVLAGGFGKVISEEGQQFDIAVTLGETEYTGKIYLNIPNISDFLNSIDLRVALEKKGSGKQDFFVGFSGGEINVYYSDGFAAAANLGEVQDAVKKITDWIEELGKNPDETPDNPGTPENPGDNTSGGSSIDTASLLKILNDGFGYTDTSATIALVTDDLLGLGIGIDASMQFSRTVDEDGFSTYAFLGLALDSLTYKSTEINLSVSLAPDEGNQIISHVKNETPFDIADYIGSVYELLDSPVYKAEISLDGSADIEYINGLVLGATAYVKPENSFKKVSASIDLDVSYSGITALLNVYYVIDTQNGGYGDIYITLKQLNGEELSARVCCGISEIIETVKGLIGSFSGAEAQALSDEQAAEVNTIASVINKVVSLDFGKIIKELKASQDKLNLTLDADKILGALGVDLGLSFGDVALELGKDAGGKAVLNGELANLGLTLGLGGSTADITAPDLNKYVDLTTYLNAIAELLNSNSYKVDITLNGAGTQIEYIKNAQLDAAAYLTLTNGFKDISAEVSASVNYEWLDVELTAYYTINLDSGKYGEVYLNVTKIGNVDVDAKVRCDITETVDAVKAIIGKFNKPAPAATYAASGTGNKVAEIIGKVLEIDFASIIKEIKANNTTVNVTVNADGLLSAFGVSLGGIEVGDVALELGKGENGKAVMSGELANFGLELNLSGSAKEVSKPNVKEYADLSTYLDYVTELLNSEVYAIKAELNGASSGIAYLENVSAKISAYAKLADDYKSVEVYADEIALSYADEDLITVSVKLSAYYTIGFSGENLGKAYINITDITLGEGEAAKSFKNLDIKVTAEISSAIDSVKAIVNTFKTDSGSKEKLQTPATTYANVAQYINYVSIVEQIKTSSTALDISLDVDGLLGMLGLSDKLGGMTFGSLALELGKNESGKAQLSASLEKLGLNIGVSGSTQTVSAPTAEEAKAYADVNEYLNGVNNLLNNENIKSYLVDLTLNGTKIVIPASEEGEKDTVIDLTGLTLNAPAQVALAKDYGSAEVFIPLTAEYVTDEVSLSVELNAYYKVAFNSIKGGNYGDIYLNLKSVTLNDKTTETSKTAELGAKVKCNVGELAESISTLIALIKGEDNGNGGNDGITTQAETTVSDIIAKVISLDYVAIINKITADGTGINLNVNVDEILKNFVDLKGFKLGNLDLTLETVAKYTTESEVQMPATVKLSGSLEKLGLSLAISGSEVEVVKLDGEYLNFNEFMDIVLAAYEQATAVIEAEDILFDIDGTLTADGVCMGVKGDGEVIWKNGKLTVSADAVLSISEDKKTSSLAIKFIYDDRVNGDEAPLVKLTIGTLGLNIYRKDIRGTAEGAQGFINSLNKLKAMFKGSNSDDNGNADGGNEETETDTDTEESEVQPMNDEGGLDIYAIANAVLGELNKFGITLTGEEDVLKDILISHANGSLKLSANGALAMDLKVSDVISVKAFVKAPEKSKDGVYATGAYTERLNTALGAEKDGEPVYTFYGSGEDGKFVKAVYEYAFDVIESLSIKEILDTDTYTVHLVLNGDNSGISALNGVKVIADLYYTEGLNGTAVGTKLVEAELDITVKNTVIKLNARYAGQSVFIELKQIAGTQIIGADSVNGIKLKADVHDIYEVAETLYNLLTGINFPEEEAPETPDNTDGEGQEGQPETQSEGETGDTNANGEQNAITALLAKILSLNLDGVILHEKADGENIYTIKPDSILEAFDVNVTIGTVTLSVNPQTHKITASATVDGNEGEWLSFNANVWTDGNNGHNTIIVEDYTDIGFVKMLVKDLANTLVDEEGNINTLYSFSGKITARLQYKYQGLPVTTNIEFNNTVLTAGLDEKGEFYLSLTASLENNPVNVKILIDIALGNITSKGNISLTYSNGYITLGRDGQYKVMTMAYFLDTLTADNSPVKWLLGTDDTLWGILKGQLPSMSSGLTSPDTVHLYETKQASFEIGSMFYLSSFLNGYQIDDGNGVIASYGTKSKAAEELGLTNKNDESGLTDKHNYYALDINGNALTNGTIRTLYAALLRNGTDDADPANSVSGISGILAKLNVMGMIDVTVTLDKRATTPAADYFKVATENLSTEAKEAIFNYSEKDGEHQTNVFGCYDTAGDGTTYYSPVLDKVTLILLDENGKALLDANGNKAEYEVTYGSTVYLDSVWAPFWSTEEGFKNYTITYGDKDGNSLGGTPVYAADNTTVIGTYIVINDDNKLDSYFDEDGNKVYTITVRRITDKSTARKAVTYYTGVEGVNEITAALALNADGKTVKLLDYDIGGYVLIGMYSNVERTVLITDKNAFAGKEVYCLYLVDTVSTEEGVIYKLHKDNTACDNNCGNIAVHYHVNSYDANLIQPYIKDLDDGGSTLFIRNVIEVNGVKYPVTAIDEKAFAYMGNATDAQENPGIGAGLKNVVVPENVVYVASKAFGDNYNIKSVVLLAPEVKFGGGSENDKNGPFYGCSVGNDGMTTNLKVYYNKVNGGSWTQFRQTGSWSKTNYYIGSNGGELFGNGNWAYVEFKYNSVNISNTVNAEDLKFGEFVDGINRVAVSKEDIEGIVLAKLNGLTAGKGYINAFTVSASCGLALNGTRYTVTITIEENDADDWYYPVNVTNTGIVSEHLTGEVAKYGDTVYAKYNSLVTISSSLDGYEVEVDSANVEYTSADDKVTFTMTEKQVNITLVCNKKALSEVTIISKVEFTYGGHQVAQNSDGYYYTTVTEDSTTASGKVEENVTKLDDLATITATGNYTFLGWSYKEGETLTFTTDTVTKPTYYAVWAIDRTGVSFTATDTVSASGELPSANKVTAENSNGLGGWYTGDTFATEITELTVENSVLYARLQYSLTVQVYGDNTQFGYSKNTSGETPDPDVASSRTDLGASNGQINSNYVERISNDGSFTSFDSILEGYNVKLYRFWANAMVITVEKENEETVVTYLFKARKTNWSIGNGYDWRLMGNSLSDNHYIKFVSGGWDPNTDLEHSGDMYYRSDNADGNKHLFGTITELKANVELYIHS